MRVIVVDRKKWNGWAAGQQVHGSNDQDVTTLLNLSKTTQPKVTRVQGVHVVVRLEFCRLIISGQAQPQWVESHTRSASLQENCSCTMPGSVCHYFTVP